MAGIMRCVGRFRKTLRTLFVFYLIVLMFLLVWWKSDQTLLFLHQPKVEDLAGLSHEQSESNGVNTARKVTEHTKHILDAKLSSHQYRGQRSTNHTFKWGPLDETYQRHYFGNKKEFCEGNFIAINSLLAFIKNITIDPKHGQGRKGGENISSVINQPENDEYFKLNKGYFSIDCSGDISYMFTPKSHLNNWRDALETKTTVTSGVEVVPVQTIAVMRYEYANLYHTMTDFYATFLVAKSFNLDVEKLNILWIDGHPSGALDNTWNVLFGNVSRAGEVQHPVLYRNMVWGIMGYDSPLNKHDNLVVPYLEEFRSFFLTRHGISDKYTLDCKQLNVLFIWRRDYLAHPRNPTGKVTRKIKNEDELIAAVTDLLPGHNVAGVQIDKLAMGEQLALIATTDVLVGMHGAGLTHTLFLPKHAGLVEIFPTYWPAANMHFRKMAAWRKLHYATWSNTDHARELPNHYTLVNVKKVINMVHEIHHKLCGDLADS